MTVIKSDVGFRNGGKSVHPRRQITMPQAELKAA
jgi:hypothetical protein